MRSARAREERELDIVVFGASGFVGRLTAGYLARAAPEGIRIGLAGRSSERLSAVRDGLGAAADSWPLVVADLAEPPSLAALARTARVVATAAGPFAPRGLRLVEACVAGGADYADLTGEVLFVRDSIDRYHAAAVAEGVKIVHTCGVDSIPSDLGVLVLAEAAAAHGSGTLADTIGLVTAFRGGFSGGTWASARGQAEDTSAHRERRRIVDDPYALSPDRRAEPDVGEQRDARWIERDRERGRWLAPFVMAGINTRVVRRSNALREWAYGSGFRYRETLAFPPGVSGALAAVAHAVGLGLLKAAGSPRAAPLLDRLLPSPGEGPDERARRSGQFAMEIQTRTSDGGRYTARIAAAGDPGYTASPVMFGQSALCLALDRDRLPASGGVLTPATAMGTALVDRLRAAGLTFDVQRPPDGG